ncbi:MAG: right-handed parallel beta-helix repeat-containing protein [Planctomycetota bacterium]
MMRRTRHGVPLWLVAALTGGMLAMDADARQSRQSRFYVSPDGDDESDGSRKEPFATLGQAQSAVRELVAAGLERDVKVLIHAGTYRCPEGLVFDARDSGTEEHPVTWAAYRGATARLVGGVRVTGWRRWKGDVLVAEVPEGTEPNQLFEGDERMTLARAPDEGYFRLAGVVKGREKREFTYRGRDIDPRGWDLSGARVFIWPGHDWFSQDKPVTAIDPAARKITLGTDQGYAMRPGNRWFIKNVLGLLDRPGECRIDLAKGKLYAWPRNGGGEGRITCATAENVVRVKGDAPERPVRNLHFEGLDIGIAKGDAVLFGNAEDCSIRFSKIENAGLVGVTVAGHARRVTIYGNLIRRHGMHGVSLKGLGPGGADVNGDHVVESNHIHHCGRLVGHRYGVRISQSGTNRIVHNHIHHMPRYGTTIKGLRYQSLRQSVKGVTFENRHDFLHSRKNLIAYNHIHHVNLDSQDTGAMESWGPGRDNVYDHNLIHDCGNDRFNLQSGIYLDDAADYFKVTNNIIWGVGGVGGDQCIFTKGIGNVIENNILIVEPTNESGIRSFFMAGERVDHHTYRRNIIYFRGAEPSPKGAFGRGAGNLHAPGKTLEWKADVPAAGEYAVWFLYACQNKPWGRTDMGGRTELAARGGAPVTLMDLPDTGGWGAYRWSRTAAIRLAKGTQVIRWRNVKGGGLNLDAIAFSDDPGWVPEGHDLARPRPGRHVFVIHAESYVRTGGDRRAIYNFQNWSDDRVSESDWNVFWKPAGEITIKGGPANGSYAKWLELGGGKFDSHSVVADPLFVDPANRDYRLKPESPALKLGFKPIDTSTIGLKADFPTRLEVR